MATNTLSDQFMDDYRQFCDQFDQLAADSFQGQALDELARGLMSKHAQTLAATPFTWSGGRFPDCSASDALNEDLKIVIELAAEGGASQEARIMAQVYRRACQGCHLRVTLNKSRRGQEQDRREAVDLGRRAIRYDATDLDAVYWYMIALGWQLDVMREPTERTLAARTFRETIQLCIRQNPSNSLAHNLLGRYYYSVAGLSWLERTIAKRLLGCKLEGTYQDSEREFRRSQELKGDWLPNALWLARALLAQKKPIDDIKPWIELGMKLECHEPSTELERNELLELRSKLKICEQ